MRKMAKPISGFEQSQLDRLYQELDRYTGLVESERAKSASAEKEIASLREDIWRRRREMGGVNAAANSRRLVEKQVRLLENKLDQALVKFNKCVSRNKELREEIDGLRGERVTFDKVSRKIEKELRSKKRQMNAIIEQSNQAYEQRDKAQLETAAIERLNRAEETAHHQKITDLSEELDRINRELIDSTQRAHTAVAVDPEEEERKEAERREVARANDILRAEAEYARVGAIFQMRVLSLFFLLTRRTFSFSNVKKNSRSTRMRSARSPTRRMFLTSTSSSRDSSRTRSTTSPSSDTRASRVSVLDCAWLFASCSSSSSTLY